MADEFTLNISGRIDKSPMLEIIQPGTQQIDVSAFGAAAGIQNINTTAEQITTTEVSTLGWAFFQNLDTTNYVTIGPYSGGTMYDFVKLKPGESCILRLMTGITIYAKANTAAVELLYKIFED